MRIRITHLLLALFLAAFAAVLSGCASTEPDNASVRPWNSPEGWEGGMLGGIMDQQHR
jgi:type IV pilus biogenesis protein CpaD/CtpE